MLKNKNQFTCPLLPPKHPRVSISVVCRCEWLRPTHTRQSWLLSHHWRLTKRSNFEEGMLWKFSYWLQVKMNTNLSTAFRGKKYWGHRIKRLVVHGSQWRDFHWDKAQLVLPQCGEWKRSQGGGGVGWKMGEELIDYCHNLRISDNNDLI